MSYELTGKLHKKFDTEVKGEKAYKNRDFVIRTDEQYPQEIKFQLSQDRCELIDNIHEGSTVTVSFDVRGREWQDKWFVNLSAWKIVPVAAVHGEPLPSQAERKAQDDLPF